MAYLTGGHMRKSLFFALSIMLIIIFSTGCNKSITSEEALMKANIETETIYLTENYEYIEILFYKDKETKQPAAGIFNVDDKGNKMFIKYVDFKELIAFKDDILNMGATFGNISVGEPGFTFQYGIINEPQIEKVKLYMIGNLEYDDRYAKIINMDGIRIWYTFIKDDNVFFNVYAGFSINDDVIYSNNPAITNIR